MNCPARVGIIFATSTQSISIGGLSSIVKFLTVLLAASRIPVAASRNIFVFGDVSLIGLETMDVIFPGSGEAMALSGVIARGRTGGVILLVIFGGKGNAKLLSIEGFAMGVGKGDTAGVGSAFRGDTLLTGFFRISYIFMCYSRSSLVCSTASAYDMPPFTYVSTWRAMVFICSSVRPSYVAEKNCRAFL
jgi:hypothetical protein